MEGKVMKALLRALMGHDGLPRTRRYAIDRPATMDPLFRMLQRHCRTNEATHSGMSLLLPIKSRRVTATVIEQSTQPVLEEKR